MTNWRVPEGYGKVFQELVDDAPALAWNKFQERFRQKYSTHQTHPDEKGKRRKNAPEAEKKPSSPEIPEELIRRLFRRTDQAARRLTAFQKMQRIIEGNKDWSRRTVVVRTTRRRLAALKKYVRGIGDDGPLTEKFRTAAVEKLKPLAEWLQYFELAIKNDTALVKEYKRPEFESIITAELYVSVRSSERKLGIRLREHERISLIVACLFAGGIDKEKKGEENLPEVVKSRLLRERKHRVRVREKAGYWED